MFITVDPFVVAKVTNSVTSRSDNDYGSKKGFEHLKISLGKRKNGQNLHTKTYCKKTCMYKNGGS